MLYRCNTDGCLVSYLSASHRHCCRDCRLSMGRQHSRRCRQQQRLLRTGPSMTAAMGCSVQGCDRTTSYSHTTCCSGCRRSGGQLHTARCNHAHSPLAAAPRFGYVATAWRTAMPVSDSASTASGSDLSGGSGARRAKRRDCACGWDASYRPVRGGFFCGGDCT